MIAAGIIAFAPGAGITAQAASVNKSISTINITTNDGTEPSYTYLHHPEGCVGNSITDNDYSAGITTR